MREFFANEIGSKVIETMDGDMAAMESDFIKIQKEFYLKAHKSEGKIKLLCLVYYSGHGILDMTTKVAMNSSSDNDRDRYWSLETKMQILS
jgi:hypothetical protein